MKNTKKILLIVLALIALTLAMSISVFADVAETDVAEVNGEGYETLAKAITAAKAGDTITLLANSNESVKINKNITIIGNNHTLGGTVTLAIPNNGETTEFKNVVFKTSKTNSILVSGANFNVTFDACTFNGAASYAIEIPSGGGSVNNLQFVNKCTVDMTGNFMQISGTVYDMLVDGMHIIKCSNAFKVNKSQNAITFNKVTADNAYIFIYGMGYENMAFDIINCDITANFPFVRQDKKVTYTYNYTFKGVNKVVDLGDSTAPVTPTEYDGLYLVTGGDLGNKVEWKVVNPAGTVAYRADVTDTLDREGIAILLKDVYAYDSLVVKVYYDDTLLFTCTRRDIDDEGKDMFPVDGKNTTANIVLWGRESGSWINKIEEVALTNQNVPNRVEVWADGVLTDNYTNPTGTVLGDQIEKYLALDCVENINYVAQIGEQGYATLEEAFAAAAEGDTIVLLADATPTLTSQRAITKASVIDLNGKTLTLTEDDLYFGTTTFKNGTIVVDPSVKPSTAVFWMFANQTLTFDAVKLVATGVTGTYLIGLDGNNSDLNLLNGSEILVENTSALDLDIICVNASTGNDIVINNSKVNVTNLDGRVFFRGNYTISGTSDIDLSGITKAGFRIEAGQTLTIKDTATVDIVGELRDGGIHLTDVTAVYKKVNTATVKATVNRPYVAEVNGVKYVTLADAIAAAKANDTIKLLANTTLSDIIVIAEETVVTLNLNGKTINVAYAENSTTNHIYAFENYGTLTITGNGTINARGIFNYGTLTLENGTINAIDGNGGYAVRNYEGATFTMKGGTIATTLEDDNKVNEGGYDATTVRVDAGATFVMNGGEIKNICDFTVAIDNHGTTTINGGTATSVHTTLANDGTMIINGGSFTCNGLEGITAHALWAAAGTTTINGGTFDGKDNYNGFNVDASAGANVVIKGGTFQAVHSGSLYGDGTITVYGGTFFDAVPAARCADGYVTIEGTGSYTVAKAVAKIGDNYYATLAEALQAAIDSGASELKILGNVREKMVKDFDLVIKADLTITADAPVKVEFYNEGTRYDFAVGSTNENKLTIGKNVSFDLVDRVIWIGFWGNNVDVVVNGYLGGYQIWHGADTTVTSTGTLDSHGEAFIMRRNATLTVNNGTVKANYFQIYSGHINAKNAEITAGLVWINNNHSYGSEGTVSVTLDNTTFTSKGVVEIIAGEDKNVPVTLKNGSSITANGAFKAGEDVVVVADSTSEFAAQNKSIFVAEVNGFKYESVLEALKAAIDNGASELKLLSDAREKMTSDFDIKISANLTITADAPVKVEFYNEGTKYDFAIGSTNNNILTIGENVSFDLVDRVIWIGLWGNNVDVVVNGYLGGYQIWHGADTTVTGELDSHGEAFIMRRNATLTVDGGKVNANYFTIYSGHINAKDAEITAGLVWINNNHSYGSEGTVSLTLDNTTFTSMGVVEIIAGEGKNVSVTLTGDSTITAKGAYTEGENVITIADEESDFAAKNVSVFVASAKGIKYTSLAAAWAAAQDGDTIKLLSDIATSESITNTKKITLDLNGKTITGTDKSTASFGLITNKGELTITGNGTITLVATNNRGWNAYSSVISNTVGGKLIVQSGTIEHLGGTDMAYGIDNLTNGKNTYAEVVINGGTVKSTYRAIRQFLNGVEAQNILTVNGGVIEGANKSIWMQDPSAKNNTGKLTVAEGATLNGDVYLSVTEGSTEYPVEVSIAASAVNGEVLTNANVPAGYVLEKANGTYKVVSGLKGSGTETDPYKIGTLKELIIFRDSVNAGKTDYNRPGVYVALTADINLASVENWAPIGTFDYSFDGNFNGNGKKIMNLKMSDSTAANGYAYLGFFGVTANNTVENFVIENVTINSNGQIVAAAIAYPYYTTVKNITVCGNIAIKGGNYTAGVLAYTRHCVNASNLTVEGNDGSYITGAQTVGGVISDIQMNGGLTANYSNFSAYGLTITGTKSVGGIAGIIAAQTLSGATVKNVTLVCSDARVGIVAGSLGGASTISNVTYENVTGASAIIGGTFDGANAIQAKIGDTYYATLEAALKAIPNEKTAAVTLLEDVTISEPIVVTLSMEIYGNGKTITYTGSNRAITVNSQGIDLSIKDLTIDCTNSYCERGINYNSNGKLSLNNVTVKGTNLTYAINLPGSSDNAIVTINGGSFAGCIALNVWGENATINATNTIFTAVDNNTVEGYASVKLNNDGTTSAEGTVINITGGKIDVTGTACTDTEAVSNGTTTGKVNISETTVVNGDIVEMVAVIRYANGTSYSFYNLKDAIAKALAGETITLLRDITASDIITINKAITLDGNGKKLTSTAGRAINVSGANGVTIKNLTINCSGERAINIIQNATNVTIENVTATAANYTVNVASSAPNAVVTIKDSNLTGLNVVNVAAAGADITIDNTTITTVDNASTEGYSAICLNKDAVNGKIVATNTIVNLTGSNANDSKAARNGAEGGYISLNGSTEGIAVDVAYISYGNTYYGFATLEAAIAKAQAGETIILLRDITVSDIIVIDKAIKLDGNGKKLTSTATRAINVSGANGVTIKNLTINASGERAINIIQNATNVTINNVTATAANYTVNVASSAPNAVVAITGSKLTGLNVVNVAAAGADITIDNTTITTVDNTSTEGYSAICLNKDAVNGKIIATNTIVNLTGSNANDSKAAKNGAEGGYISLNGSTEGIAVDVAYISYGNTYYGFATLEAAIAKAQAGETIVLLRDVTIAKTLVINKSVNIDGNKHTITYTGSDRAIDILNNENAKVNVTIKKLTVDCTASYCQRGINYNDDGALTLNNVTVKGTNLTYALNLPGLSDNCEVTITDSNLSGNIALNVWGENATINATNTIFTAVDNNTVEGYASVKLNNDGTTSAEGTVINITGGKIDVTGTACTDTEAVSNGTTTGEVNISETTVVNGDIVEMVAVIRYANGTSYSFYNLNDAIAKAVDGDTITLLRDITLTENDDKTVVSGYKVMISINKSITFDFNGNTINFTNNASTNNASDDLILSVFHIANGVDVVIKDSGKNGGINVNAKTVKVSENKTSTNVGYVIWKQGTEGTLDIQGGKYYANDLEDSMVYTNSNKKVTVSGGSFILDTVGTRANRSPWIFNAQGTNERKIVIKGGSFNADVFHQYWIFEIHSEKEIALKNVDGMYTVVDAVAYVNEQHWSGKWYTRTIGYASLEEAIAACGIKDKDLVYGGGRPITSSKPETVALLKDITLAENTTIVIEKGQNVILKLYGHDIYGENTRTATHNFLFDVKGSLTVSGNDGSISMKHTGAKMGWSGATTVFNVTAGGVLKLTKTTVENLGGTEMNFAIHLNNWGEVTLVADECELLATYCAVRVFNSGYDMNNVTIVNSKLTGATRAFWVHNYIGDLDSSKHSDDAINARLNLNIYNLNNVFEITGEATSPIRYGFDNTVYFDKDGNNVIVVDSAEELKDALENAESGSTVVLDKDLDLNDLANMFQQP